MKSFGKRLNDKLLAVVNIINASKVSRKLAIELILRPFDPDSLHTGIESPAVFRVGVNGFRRRIGDTFE